MAAPERRSKTVAPRSDAGPADRATAPGKFRRSVRLAAIAFIILVLGGLLEGGARIAFSLREEIHALPLLSDFLQSGLDLDPYEMPSPAGGLHWVLRPGYQATVQGLIEKKREAGRYLGVRALKENSGNSGTSAEIVFRINSDGFKGPEIDRAHARPRILALGDSTTFGGGAVDYPRVIAAVLGVRGVAAEVINGGVEGYSPRNVIYELDRYKSLKPEIVTLYIGWNALYARNPWSTDWENRVRFFWLAKSTYRALRLMVNAHGYALSLINRNPHSDPASSDVARLTAYSPPFLSDIDRIISALESGGAQVILVTLPGLFTSSERPSVFALKKGHMPDFTNNPFVLAKLTERYNDALRDLARRRGLGVIDLEKWSIDAFQPRDAYFTDSVHLNARGLEKIGAFMAEQLIDKVEKSQAAMKRGANR